MGHAVTARGGGGGPAMAASSSAMARDSHTAPVDTDFPSLSASGSRLFVPEGDQVVSYLGI